jgi:4-amino-4-deoxy-L-arabinose transferase-like glycosyltransferase
MERKPILISVRQRVIRAAIHAPVGFLTGFCEAVLPNLGLILCLGFLTYEVVEDWRIRDRGFHDIYGFLIGVGIFGILAFLIRGG